jgi:hypothetical protein
VSRDSIAPARSSRIRGWFRHRLDWEPRRWVLFIAAAEGLVGYAGWWVDRTAPSKLEAFWTAVGALFLTFAPVGALVMLVVHCRLLYWAGKPLGGRARPFELHAAAAWSALPVALAGWPDVLRLTVNLVKLDRTVMPAWLLFLGDAAEGLARVAHPVQLAAALVSLALYIVFLAEAQQFSKLRAAANQLLAGLLFVALGGSGIALGWIVSNHQLVGLPVLACAAVALVAWRIAAARRLPATR